ncbi:MAG: cation-transporting P-type ATPase [Bryobacterales bacterium]|nr:cation-transporting P-type ATPase [Bryobacterales bacterium]
MQIAFELAALPAPAVLSRLSSAPQGLTASEAAGRLRRYGPNLLPRPQREPWYLRLATNFSHFFALLLWVGAVLAWVAGMRELAVAIAGVVLVNGLFSYWQEYEAERAVEELEAMLPHQVTVRREGQERSLAAAGLVPGDVVVLREGEAIPADARVILSERLRLDTSAMTGESRPVPRSADPAADGAGALLALPNVVLAGSSVLSGHGEAVIFATGAQTEFGRIAQLTGRQRERPSPLEKELRWLTRLVAILAVSMGAVFYAIGTVFGGLTPVTAFLFSIGIIVANVPEGLLPTLTLALAMGVRRMAARQAVVKRLSAVEALGAATIIFTDKTGTLTENEMTVEAVWTSGRRTPDNDGEALEVLRVAALCCDAYLTPKPHGGWNASGDPTETAILLAAASRGLRPENLQQQWPRLGELPFDSVRKRMTTIQRGPSGPFACVKGASTEVLPRSTHVHWNGVTLPLDNALRNQIREAREALASGGLRVLAVATRPLPDTWSPTEVERDLTFLGLIAMHDPPRPEVPGAIAACRRAGVRVVMVTGDDPLTAGEIALEIGLTQSKPRAVSGDELARLSMIEVDALFENPDLLFARVAPEQKLQLVEACQRRGDVVAVTGDGVNDAPALKRADIGVAMGATGTDVAREAADVVLTDDNFASIAAAIEEGRTAYENVRKFVTYILASNIPELVPFILFVLLGIPLPLTIMQVLAVDLGTDLVPALALGAERAESGLMLRPPRPRDERLVDRNLLLRAYAWLGMLEAAFSLSMFFAIYWLPGWRPGQPMADTGPLYLLATTMTLAGIVACQVGNVFACRSLLEPAWRGGLFRNRLILAGIAVELAILCALIYAPPLASAFGLAPLAISHWLLLAPLPLATLLAEETRKALLRSRR